MFIETRYFDDGKVLAKMHETKVAIADTDEYDAYLEEYESIEAFTQELIVDPGSMAFVAETLRRGALVDVTDCI